jgi:TolA-binding protein
MAEDRDQWADTLSAQSHGGWLTSFLADEDSLDRRMLWRLGSWGFGAVAAVVVAVLASQSQSQLRREQVASSDLMARQSQQIQFVTRETQTETKRLSHAIDTLNGDRDRLYSRVTSIEQGLESVTGSIKRQTQAALPVAAAPAAAAVEPAPPQTLAALPTIPSAPLIGPVASSAAAEAPAAKAPAKEAPVKEAVKEPAIKEAPKDVVKEVAKEAPTKIVAANQPILTEPLVAWKSMMAPPDVAASKLSDPPPAPPAPAAPETTASVAPAAVETPATPVPRTEFGIDVGTANSVDGLRALWRGISASNKALAGLRPIIMVKERASGLGMQLRLVLGPIGDAATAAKICAIMTESNRTCETSVFDGQRLALKNDAPAPEAVAPAKPAPRKRALPKNERTERAVPSSKPAEEPAPPPPPQSSLTSFLGMR